MAISITNIKDLSLNEIENFLISKNEKKFKAKQVFDWLWRKNVNSFSNMTNISIKTRDLLSQHFFISNIKIHKTQISSDETKKYAFCLPDNKIIEGVLIPTANRTTACISSQVGCPLGCSFCATGKLNYLRNLNVAEIVEQVHLINDQSLNIYSQKLSNIVLMGMGEPLLNYNNVLQAINLIIHPDILGFSPQRITLSTVGLCKEIKMLGDNMVKFNLAISLHTANNNKRNQLMPINKSNPLPELIKAIQYFVKKTNTRVTFEYLLLGGYNDSITDARELAEFCKNFPSKINLIEYNSIDESLFKKSAKEKVIAFNEFLLNKNLVVNIRQSRGQDIDAACGQLANKET